MRKPALITFLAAVTVTLVCACVGLFASRLDTFDFLAGKPLIEEDSTRRVNYFPRWEWVRRYYTFRASVQEARELIEPELTAKGYKQSDSWRGPTGRLDMVEYGLTSSAIYTNESYVRIYTHMRYLGPDERDLRQDGVWGLDASGWVTLEVVFKRKPTPVDKLLVKGESVLESVLSR